jgi:[protein-PII] uridylyltransferase
MTQRRAKPPVTGANTPGKKSRTAPGADTPQSREEFVQETRKYFALLTKPLFKLRTPRTPGKEFVSTYSRMVDTITGILFQRAAQDNGLSPDQAGVAVIAMGGYGRAELAPYSDVDILILCRRKTPAVEAMAGDFIRYMWDAGFELGHSVESLVESETALSQDMDTKTALIESRWVCGSKPVAKAVEKQISRIRRKERQDYLARKVADALSRYEKYGRSFQLIEPNVKNSPGGMRDYQTLVWLGQVNRTNRGLRALRVKGLLLTGEQRELEEAYDYLMRVRVELHLATQSKQDQLTVAMQRKLAGKLGYRSRSNRLDVEFFMRDYYSRTRAIYRITSDVLEALHHGKHVGILLGRRPVRHPDKLALRLNRDKIKKEPLYVFERQKETGKSLDRSLRRRLEVVKKSDLKGSASAVRMRRAFSGLLGDDKNLGIVVRSLHDTGFLGRIIPEYNSLTCLKRYDLYHHYTVDEHSFQVLENLIDLGSPEKDPADPMVRLYSEVDDKRSLFFAALLHDVGKIEGRGHAAKGAVLSRKILARLGVSEAEKELVDFLIENHLLMSKFSQRRDSTDIDTLKAFCRRVKTRTNLKYLCLLTCADYKATSPLVWNEWKQTLLWDLYLRAYELIQKKAKKPDVVYKSHKKRLLDAFPGGEQRRRALEHLDLLPGRYLLTMDAGMVKSHMEMIATLNGRSAVVSHRKRAGLHEFTFCTQDQPFRLSQLCGVLTINDFNILNAYAFTRKDGKVIDVFLVEDLASGGGGTRIEEQLEKVREDVENAVQNKMDLDARSKQHSARWRRARRAGIPTPVKIKFENDLSGDFTIIDIFAQDEPGLLFKITNALSQEGLKIYRAYISTEATLVIDSFYVMDEANEKITAAGRLKNIRASLAKKIT